MDKYKHTIPITAIVENNGEFLSSYKFVREEDFSSSVGFVFIVKSNNREMKKDESIEEYKWIKPEEIADYDFSYKPIKDFDLEDKVTIPGMEVHVRNAIIALKNNMLIDYRSLSVSGYQDKKCSINKQYLIDLQNSNSIEKFCIIEDKIFPKLN